MDLAAKRSALLQNKFVMRLGCVLVAVGFLVSSVVTPMARAVAVVDDVAVGAMSCAAFLESIGLPLSATATAGVPAAELVSGGITAVAGEYAAATGAAASGDAFLGSVAAGTTVSTAGLLVLTAAASYKLGNFVYWLYDTYIAADDTTLYSDSGHFTTDGQAGLGVDRALGTTITFPDGSYATCDLVEVASNSTFDEYVNFSYSLRSVSRDFTESGEVPTILKSRDPGYAYKWFLRTGANVGIMVHAYLDGNLERTFTIHAYSSGASNSTFWGQSSTRSLILTDIGYSPLPELSDSQQLQIDVGAAPGTTVEELVQQIPQQVVDGTLSTTITVVTTPVPPPDLPQGPGDVEDVDELGLPSLGEALTRRFTFSIPWDIARGITLLAAPAKTPYFEVDFYAPISDLVGGWQGSTKIVLDFSQFESLGRLSRWTSTIGFCLFLASATKRFIWTA